jgi:hypothetical protein
MPCDSYSCMGVPVCAILNDLHALSAIAEEIAL